MRVRNTLNKSEIRVTDSEPEQVVSLSSEGCDIISAHGRPCMWFAVVLKQVKM